MKKWEENVRRVIPYTPGEQPKGKKLIKLNTNENPYPPSPGVAEVLQRFSADNLRLYPDPEAGELVHALAEHYGLSDDQVFAGVGSDDVLALSFLTFFNAQEEILFPDITYSFYDVWASLYRIPYRTPALDDRFLIRPEDYLQKNGGIIFPNPNAPTGAVLPLADIRRILDANRDVVVIVDEAYIDFGGTSALPLIDEYDNLLVVQTFSKSRALAGLRIGYAFGNPTLIKYLQDVKYSFNSYTMNSITIQAGAAAVRDHAYYEETCRKIKETREWTKKELSRLGFSFPDSSANFIFASHREVPAQQLFTALRDAGILVRYFNRPRIDDHLRITIGTPEEMRAMIRFLEDYLSASR